MPNGWGFQGGAWGGFAGGYGAPGGWGLGGSLAATRFLQKAAKSGMPPEQAQALTSFLQTSQGRSWVESLSPEQVDYMTSPLMGPTRIYETKEGVELGRRAEPVAGYGPALPYVGAGWPAAPSRFLPSPEAPYGYGIPFRGEEIGAYRAAQPAPTYGGYTPTATRAYTPTARPLSMAGSLAATLSKTESPEARATLARSITALLRPTTTSYQAAYQAALPEFESPAMETYYKTQATPMYQSFLAKAYEGTGIPPVAETIAPFGEYLGKYPFLEEYRKRTPREKGVYTGQFVPPTRWLSY